MTKYTERTVRKYKKVRKGHGCFITATEIRLICRCGKEAIIPTTGEDTDILLDRLARGWITTTTGAAVCPACVTERKFTPPMFGHIHG